MSEISRRALIRTGLSAGAAMLAPAVVRATVDAPAKPRAAGGVRFAHLTDMHIQPELRADDGYAAALRSLAKLDPQPDFVITGGDHVMDSFEHRLKRVKVQWDLYDKVLSENLKLPVYATLGNHDVFGWGKDPTEISPATSGYGKAMALDRLRMQQTYYSFDRAGWHFVILDNISRRDHGYFAGLDDEQTEWLKGDLAGNDKPVCVVTHIPLLSACVFFDLKFDDNTYQVNDALMQREVKPLLTLLRANNTKLCLSGHIHLVDRVDYLGMTFLCNGAVCGNWWKGPRQEFPEGYGVIDIYPDGGFDHQYVDFGWRAATDAEK